MLRITLIAFILLLFGSGFTNYKNTNLENPEILSALTAQDVNHSCEFYRDNPFGDGNNYALVTADDYFIATTITLYSDSDCQIRFSTKDSAGYVYSTTGDDIPLTICQNNGADDVFNVGGDFYICINNSDA